MPRIVDELTAAGFTFDSPDDAVWTVLSDFVASGDGAHIASRSVSTDPAATGTPVEGATCLRSTANTYRSASVWQTGEGLIAVVAYADGDITVRAYAADQATADRLALLHAAAYPAAPTLADGDVRMRFWYQSTFGADSRVRRLACPTWGDVAANYPTEVRAQLAVLAGLDPEADNAGRLILMHGEPGTGKSWALRALAAAWSPWLDVHYITDPDELLGDASYLTTLLTDTSADDRWRLIVMEDSGEFVSDDARARSGAGLGRLLNAADGLLGQGTRTMFLLTTNEPLDGLHPALTRPGRCLASIHLGAFPEAEASEWLGAPAGSDLTLAELWERRRATPEVVAASAAQPPQESGMTWKIIPQADGRFRVVNPAGRYRLAPDKATAAGLIAAAMQDVQAAAPPDDQREPFAVLIGFLGGMTSDKRLFDNAQFRRFPWPFMYQPATEDMHDGSLLVGRVDRAEIVPGAEGMAARVIGYGSYDRRIPEAEQAIIALANGVDGVSWDAGSVDGPEYECTEWADDGWCDSARAHWGLIEIAMVTQLGFPAFAGSQVVLGNVVPDGELPLAPPLPPEPVMEPYVDEWCEPAPPPREDEGGPRVVIINAAHDDHACACGGAKVTELAAAGAPVAVVTEVPPLAWFARPAMREPTPLTILDNGRWYGHLALNDTCHIGITGQCVTLADVREDGTYKHFRLTKPWGPDGPITGVLTYLGGHAPSGIGAAAAMAHYDDVTTAWGDGVVGDDEFGIWGAGVVRPRILRDPEAMLEIRASCPSGDWRSIDGAPKLIKFHMVNTPGFQVLQPELVASAAGGIETIETIIGLGAGPVAALREQTPTARLTRVEEGLRQMRAAFSPLLDLAADQLPALAEVR